MRRIVLALVAVAACGVPAADGPAADAPGSRTRSTASGVGHARTFAFVDVAVAGMERPEVAGHQTVVVRGGTIVAIGPVDEIEPPAQAERIDGRGKFLIPGLHDMHVHLDGTRGMLAQLIESGVTTVRNMAGSTRTLALRDRIARGDLLGPTIFTAGPFVDGTRPRWEYSVVVKDAADAERVVADQAAAGYDFVKVYNGLTLDAYDALATAAKAHGMRLVGHVPLAVPLEHALESQASIEHLSGYAEALERADSPVRKRRTDTSVIRRWLYVDQGRIPDLAAATARHAVWNCPTLVTSVTYGELWRGHVPPTDLDTVSPDWRARWDPTHSPQRVKPTVRAAMEQAHGKTLETELALVRELTAAGAPLLAGTDTPNPYVVPGVSLHQELGLFVAAGLSPYAALRTATIDAADFLGEAHSGRVELGAAADLVLLDADPLADLGALDHIAGVMTHGEWLARDRLRALHDERVATYRAPPWEAAIELGDAVPGARPIQYVIADNGAPIGAYAVSRQGAALVERQTLEDETITTRTTYGPDHRVHSIALDIDRPEGRVHAEHATTDHLLIGSLTPATALALVDTLALDVDQKLDLSLVQPDPETPTTLAHGHITITRIEAASETERAYLLRLAVDHGAWVARLVVEGDGLPHLFKISYTSRPIVRTWRRR